jgi:NAD(P)-dependent dehydrogenase (short-subunit alcohol dehydrogenase family)
VRVRRTSDEAGRHRDNELTTIDHRFTLTIAMRSDKFPGPVKPGGAAMMIDYANKVVLVTGAASGIGRALAIAIAARGGRVIAADIDGAGVAETARLTKGEALVVDLAQPGAAVDLIDRAYTLTGHIDMIASNAGMGSGPGPKRLLKADLDAPRVAEMFEVNMFAAIRLVQAWVPRLEATNRRGRLMITGSENSLSVPDAVKGFGLGLYAASKHGVLVLAEWLRHEMAAGKKPLDVHVLLPGGVYTGMTADGLGPDPAGWPADMHVITAERCAEIALDGLDKGLFWIPTHRHLADDMGPRHQGVADAVRALGL